MKVTVNPRELKFREFDQVNIDAIRQITDEVFGGEIYNPIVAIRSDEGIAILDGHHRAVIAIERNLPLPAVMIEGAAYIALQAQGYDDMEIAFAALMVAGETEAADALSDQFPIIIKKGSQASDTLEAMIEEAVNNG